MAMNQASHAAYPNRYFDIVINHSLQLGHVNTKNANSQHVHYLLGIA